MNNLFTRLIRLGFIVLLLLGVYRLSVLAADFVEREYIYVLPYREAIVDYGSRYGVDPCLIAAVARTESKFRPQVISPSGAVGIMQLMPETAEWIAKEQSNSFDYNELFQPEHNIGYGVWYLSFLIREFEGNEILALAAYNAGIATVHEWIEIYSWMPYFMDTAAIPYPETRHYVDKVLGDREHYRRLYPAIAE